MIRGSAAGAGEEEGVGARCCGARAKARVQEAGSGWAMSGEMDLLMATFLLSVWQA